MDTRKPKYMHHTWEDCLPVSGQAAKEIFKQLPTEIRKEFHRQCCLSIPGKSDVVAEVVEMIRRRRFTNAGLAP